MPKNKNIKSILIIGSGPIVIGQACEFDYSGSQAAKSLKNEGYRVILVNSNPATIMTDPEMADATYIEPLTPEFLKRIIEIEKPDAVLPTLGGQTALNATILADKAGILEKYNVEVLGTQINTIISTEDRQVFNGLSNSSSGTVGAIRALRRRPSSAGRAERTDALRYVGNKPIWR